MEHRALGKGLSALIPEQVRAANDKEGTSNSNEITYVRVSSIQNNTYQPRSHYDRVKLDELKVSIQDKGLLQPILVRKSGDGFEVIAGERRLRAARELGLEEIPAMIKEASSEEALVLALVENIQREELNAIEEALAFKRLTEEFHLTQEQVARSIGKDRTSVTNMLRLLKLPSNIQKSVVDGLISMGHARTLCSVEEPATQQEIFQEILKKGLSVREVENLVQLQRTASGRARTVKQTQKSHDYVFLEEDLQQFFGTKVRIQPQKKRGKIVIEYYSPDDLDRILRIIRERQ